MKSGGFHLSKKDKKEIIEQEEVAVKEAEAEETAEEKENKEPEAEEAAQNLCQRCGKAECEEGEDFCEDCLGEMLNTRIPLIGWIAGAASIIVSVVAAAAIFFLAAPAFLGLSGEIAARDNRWSDAYYYYNQMDETVAEFQSLIEWKEGKQEPILRRLFQMGTGAEASKLEAYARAYNPVDAIYNLVASDYSSYEAMASGASNLLSHKKAAPYWDVYNSISYTEAVLYYSEEQPEGEDYEANIKFLDSMKKQADVDKVFIAYRKAVFAKTFDRPVAERLSLLEECDKLAQASGKDYKWLYYYDYADALFESGKKEQAIEKLDQLISENKNNFKAYVQKTDFLIISGNIPQAEKLLQQVKAEQSNYGEVYEMEIKILRCKGEYEKAKALGETVIGENDIFPEIRRQMALIYLIEGDYKNAFSQTDKAYSNAYNMYMYGGESPSEKLALTYYVCASLYEATGEYTEAEANGIGTAFEIFGEDYKPEGEIMALLKGEKTAKEILTEGDYDLT